MSDARGISQVSDDRLARLPAYAQDEIQMSRKRIAELTAELRALLNPDQAVTTYADPYHSRPKPIGDNPTVRHRLQSGDELTLDLGPHGIRLTGTSRSYWSAPAVFPEVSNVLHVKMLDTRTLPGADQ